MSILKWGAPLVALAMSVALTPTVALADDQDTLGDVSVVYVTCYQRTKYIYDGFDVYPAGTETACDFVLSNGKVFTSVVEGYA